MSRAKYFIICEAWGYSELPSLRVQCCNCGAQLALDPASQARFAAKGVRVLCAACALPAVDAGAELVSAGGGELTHVAPGCGSVLRYLREAAARIKPPS